LFENGENGKEGEYACRHKASRGLIALSPHDSSAKTIQAIRDAYPGVAQDIKVGQVIALGK
jgi:hypothetical protein